MKYKRNLYLILSLCMLLLYSCSNDNIESTGIPAAITEYQVTPINGGAVITYAVPKDPNILCVTAEYLRNGQKYIERSSFYKDYLMIEGFKDQTPVNVTLYTENRNGDRSKAVTFQFTPLEALVDLTKESLDFLTTFGGVVLSWENKMKSELNVRLMAFVDGDLVHDEIYYSSNVTDKRSYRGFESVETTYAVTIGDKWGNISDTIFYTTTPIFEMEVPKPWSDMRPYVKGDNLTEYGASHSFSKFHDGVIGGGSVGYLNRAGSEGASFTFDMHEVFKLSRFKFWPSLRDGVIGDVYGNVNITEFEMWGSPVLDITKPDSYWEDSDDPAGTFKEEWVYLGYFARERLDLEGATDDEIWRRGAVDGDEFELPLELGPVRYIRFFARATADGRPVPNNYWQLGELSFFGTNQLD